MNPHPLQKIVVGMSAALLFALVCLILVFLVSGCASPASKAAKEKLKNEATKKEADARYAWISTSLAIGSQALTSAGGEVDSLIASETDPLKKSKLTYIGKDIRTAHGSLRKADYDSTKQKVAFSETITRAEKAEADLEKPLTKKLNGLVVIGIGLAIGGMIAGLAGGRFSVPYLGVGFDVAAGGGLMVGASLATKAVGPYAWIAGISSVFLFVGVISWYVVQAIREGRLRKGFVQVVATGEKVRRRADVYTDAIAEEAKEVQSEPTRQLVREVKRLPEFQQLVGEPLPTGP